MLVLSRKMHEVIKVGNDITITIVRIKGNVVRVGIEAPANTKIRRGELPEDPEGRVEQTESTDEASAA